MRRVITQYHNYFVRFAFPCTFNGSLSSYYFFVSSVFIFFFSHFISSVIFLFSFQCPPSVGYLPLMRSKPVRQAGNSLGPLPLPEALLGWSCFCSFSLEHSPCSYSMLLASSARLFGHPCWAHVPVTPQHYMTSGLSSALSLPAAHVVLLGLALYSHILGVIQGSKEMSMHDYGFPS